MKNRTKKKMSLAVGAASAAMTLAVGSGVQASYPNNFQGYEPSSDPDTWVHFDGSSLTVQATGTTYGTGTITSLSGSYYGLLDPATSGLAYGQYANAGFNKLPPGDTLSGNSSWPGATFQFQAFIYLSNQLTVASPNNVNDIAWFPISVNEDLGGGSFTYAHSQNYRVKRTATNVTNGTFGLYEAGTGGGIALFDVPGDAWYGIHEVYTEDPSGFGKVVGSWTDATGSVLGTFSTIFDGTGGVPVLANGGPWAGFRTFFPNFWDTSSNIDDLGIPVDNVAVLFGDTMVIPPHEDLVVPEPASSVALLAGGALLMSRRRKVS